MNNEKANPLLTPLRGFLAAVFLTVAILIAFNPAQAAPPVPVTVTSTALSSSLVAPSPVTFSAPVFAQVTPPVLPADLPLADKIVAFLTPILVPLVLAAAKKFAPSLPGWALPLAAPVLGFLIGLINNLVAAHSTNLWLAAGLGLLGVAVREVKEAVVPAPNGGWPDPNKLP